MRTAKEMIKYAFDNNLIDGQDVFRLTIETAEKKYLKHFELVQNVLFENENVEIALLSNGYYDGARIEFGGSTAVVFTSKRLIVAQKTLFGSPVKLINLEKVTDVHKDNFLSISEANICIDMINEHASIRLEKKQVDNAFNIIMKYLENFKKESEAKNVTVQQVSCADELKKFKELLDANVITQEEFDAKKKQLLGL